MSQTRTNSDVADIFYLLTLGSLSDILAVACFKGQSLSPAKAFRLLQILSLNFTEDQSGNFSQRGIDFVGTICQTYS